MGSENQKRLRASLAAHVSWARTIDREARTRPGREAFLRRFEDEVDPDGSLSPHERARRADHLLRAYMRRLALRSVKARKAGGNRQ